MPEIEIVTQTFHPGQVKLYHAARKNRFLAARCGRRYGKTDYGIIDGAHRVAQGQYIGWFAPEYKFIAETYRAFEDVLDPIKKSASKDGVYQCIGGGRIDFWSLENERAGRSRKYHYVYIDEGAFTKDTMLDTWRKNIRPTLLDYKGGCTVLSNTNGDDPTNFMWQICNQPEHGFKDFHAPTSDNPYLPKDEVAKLKKENHPLVYQQEYEAEFVDWSGVAFFPTKSLLINGEPAALPEKCDAVFAIVDSATKTGKENDGTGVTYFAFSKHAQVPLIILDWDVVQIEGALLETWLPQVFKQLEHFAKLCKARNGSLGAHIEDKASGMVLIQQAKRRQWPARAIDSKLTSLGKDERAISVSGYVYRGMVKICKAAFEKVTTYKNVSRNHFIGQVSGFRIGDKEANKREDDLLDTFCYGIALALGDAGGF